MTTTNRIVSIETHRIRPASHEVIFAVSTRDEGAVSDRRWTVRSVLQAMDRAERFYSQAPNGRRARVQRYPCAGCHQEHIRTHLSDGAIHDLTMLAHTDGSPVAAVRPYDPHVAQSLAGGQYGTRQQQLFVLPQRFDDGGRSTGGGIAFTDPALLPDSTASASRRRRAGRTRGRHSERRRMHG